MSIGVNGRVGSTCKEFRVNNIVLFLPDDEFYGRLWEALPWKEQFLSP